jgi:hypothetical protein
VTEEEPSRIDKQHIKQVSMLETSRSWIDEVFARVARGDFKSYIAQPRSIAEDFHDVQRAATEAHILFRSRSLDRAKHNGSNVQDVTFRKVGHPPDREYDRVLLHGIGDYAVVVWSSGPTIELGILIDLWKYRALAPRIRQRLEAGRGGGRPFPFAGIDSAGLMSHGVGLAAYPDDDAFIDLREPPMEGQEPLL